MIKKNTNIAINDQLIGAWFGRVTGLLVALALTLGVVSLLSPAMVYAEATDICNAGARCNSFIETYVNPFIILLSGLVGVAAVISIIVAGIQYSSSADDPGTVTKAKQRIFSTIIGLVAYIFLFAFLNYLVPGGIL